MQDGKIRKVDFGQYLLHMDFKVWYEYLFKIIWGNSYIRTKGNEKIFEAFNDIYDRKITRLNINCPARAGKTQTAAAFLVYTSLRNKCNWIYTSANKQLLGFVRDYIETFFKNSEFLSYYPSVYQIEDQKIDDFTDDIFYEERKKDVKDEKLIFSSKKINIGGTRIYFIPRGSIIAGIASGRVVDDNSFTGGIVMDDIQRTGDSKYIENKLQDWYTREVLTRLENKDCIILDILHRLTQTDISNFLEKTYNFTTLKLPLLDENGEVQFLKSKYNVEELKKNNYTWQALYMQEPIKKGGNVIKSEWFRNYDFEPYFKHTIITCDTALKVDEKNDYSIFMFSGVTNDKKIFILDILRGKWEAQDLIIQLRNFYYKCCQKKKPLKIFIEDKASGIGLIQSLKTYRLPIEPITPKKNKEERMLEVLPELFSGNVFIPSVALWRNDFLDEVESFPTGKHDDMCDCLAYTLKYSQKVNPFLASC